MSAVIHQLVLRRRAAVAQSRADALARDEVIAAAKGAPGLVWRGDWDRAIEYLVGDGVACNGSSYIAVDASIDTRPPGTAWDLLAAKGKDGKPGKDGQPGIIAIGGGVSGGTDFSALPIGDASITPQAIALKQNGVWVQLAWSDFLSLVGSTAPANTTTVNGEAITVNGEIVVTE